MAEELVEVVVGSRRAETRQQRTGSKGENNERRGGLEGVKRPFNGGWIAVEWDTGRKIWC